METKFLKRGAPSKSVEVYKKISELNIGESLVINRFEWRGKGDPERAVITRSTGVVCSKRTLADGSGWYLTRIR